MTKPALNFNQDGHKLFWHPDRVQAWMRGERIAPVHIELGTGPRCNFHCLFCFTAFQKGEDYALDRETFLKIMHDAAEAGVRSIGILGDGEPTLNPALAEAIACGRRLGLDIGLATNGLLFDEALARSVLPNLTWIRFTTCAAAPEVFETVHRIPGRHLAVIDKHLSQTAALKRELQLKTTIGVQMVLVPENIREAVPAAQRARRLGADYFTAKQASLSPHNAYAFNLDFYDAYQDLLREVEAQSTENFASIVAWKKILSHGRKDYGTCYGFQMLLQVTGKGEVYPCSELVGREEFRIGDFREETLLEMIRGRRYRNVLTAMENNLDPETDCATCCRHDAVNRFLWILKHPPDHINFI